MAPISVELKVISSKDIKAFNFFQKLCISARVSIVNEDPDNKQKTNRYQEQKTPVDREGDGNPEWNHEVRFDLKQISNSLDFNHLFLEFQLRCEGIIFLGNKFIGQVRVPFTDLIEESNGIVRFVSYQVRTSDGIPNGVLDFSYKVIDDEIGSFYPKIDNDAFQLIYPSPAEVYYPSPAEVYYPSPPEMYYPSPEVCNPPPPKVYCPPPPEVYCPPPPQVYYPPPPQVYYAPQPPLIYPAPPGGYNYPVCGCSTVDQLRPYDDDTWRMRL